MKELICITCPKGCHLKVDEETFAVTGNSCPRGAVYGANELRNPVRVVTSTVIVEGPQSRLPETSPAKGRGTGEAGGGVDLRRLPETSPAKGRGTGEAGGGVSLRRLPVKTDRAIPKSKMFEVMDEIARVRVTPPVAVGQILIPHVAGTDGNVVATKNLP